MTLDYSTIVGFTEHGYKHEPWVEDTLRGLSLFHIGFIFKEASLALKAMQSYIVFRGDGL